MADYPLINGHKYDYSSIELDFNGTIYLGVQEISYTQTLEPGIVRGTSAQKLARTRGEHDAEGTLVMYKQDFDEFITDLATGDEGYGEVSFDISVVMSTPNQPTSVVRLLGCRITSEEESYSQGTDALVVSCDLDIMLIEKQGLRMISNALV